RSDADRLGLVVAVVRVERSGEIGTTGPPFSALTNESVGDVTECGARPAKSGADPICELATHAAVSVVHPDESDDGRQGHSIAEPTRTTCASALLDISPVRVIGLLHRYRHQIQPNGMIDAEPLAVRWRGRARTIP